MSKDPPVAPTLPSKTAVESSDLKNRPNVAVPVATAVPEVIAFAVAVTMPPEIDDAGKAVAENVSVTSKVLPDSGASGLAGCVHV